MAIPLARRWSWYLAPVMVGNLMQLVTLPVFTRVIDAEGLGAWALSTSVATVATGVVMLGLPTAYERNYFACDGIVQRAGLFYAVLACSALGVVAMTGAAWMWREPLSLAATGRVEYASLLVLAAAATGLTGLKDLFLTHLRNAEESRAYGVYALSERIGASVLQLVLVAGVGYGAAGLLVGQLVAAAVSVGALSVRFASRLPVAFSSAALVDALRIGLPLVPRQLVGLIGSNADKFVISRLDSLGMTGLYAVAQRVANVAFTYMTALGNVYRPRTYEWMFGNDAEAPVRIGRYLTPFAYLSTVVAFGLAVFAEEALWVLAAPEYVVAAPVASILAAHYGLQFFGKIPQITFSGRTYLIPLLSALSVALTLVAVVAGVEWWGAEGAAWGTLAAGLLTGGVTLAVGQWCYPVRWQTGWLLAIFGVLLTAAASVAGMDAIGVAYELRLGVKVALSGAFGWMGWQLYKQRGLVALA